MANELWASATEAEVAPADESAQPIFIRRLDRLETTSPNSSGAS
jgi:hypothetical protein